MLTEASVSSLQPLTVGRLLTLLLAARDEEDAPRRARVTLHLHGGARLEGWLVGLSAPGGESPTVMLQCTDASERPGDEIVYVERESICGVSVKMASGMLDVLSEGRLYAEGGPIVTRLGLRRDVLASATRFAERAGFALGFSVDWEHIDDAQPVLRALARLVRDVSLVMEALLSEEAGREAVRALSAGVRIESGPGPSVEPRDGALIVRADLRGGPRGSFDRASLRKAIEAAL